MKTKKIFGIWAVILIILLVITPITNSITLEINKNKKGEQVDKTDDCGCNNSKEINNNIKHTDNYYLGLLPGGDPLPPKEEFMGRAPSSWDWRNKDGKDWTTPIKDQGNCGSCYAFGSYAAMESCIKIKSNKPNLSIDLSEQFMVSCGKEWVSGIYGCNGAQLDPIFQFIETYGAIPESCFPYTSWSGSVPPCSNKCSNWEDLQIYIDNWGSVSSSQSSIKNALIQYGPLPTKMSVYVNFYDYSGGIYEPSGSLQGYHLVAIVGYNDNPGYWICKNSWGKDWGENGWFRIKYGVCEIEEETIYLEVKNGGNIFQEIKCGIETSKRSGDIYNYNNCQVSMAEHIWAGDATAWYEFDVGEVVIEDIEIGVEFADWGWIGDGPNLYVYNWIDKKYTLLGKDLGNSDEFNWVWKTTSNSNDYISADGIIEVNVWAEDDDWVVIYHVGVKGQLIKPDLKCNGDLQFGYVPEGQSVTKSIKVENDGDSGSDLDWKISSLPGWGTWTITPLNGENLKPEDGNVTVTVKVVAPTTQDDFLGNIKIINENDDSDYEIIDTSLSTQRTKQSLNKLFTFSNERFPEFLTIIPLVYLFTKKSLKEISNDK
jgi:C1A family cysteine protease